MPSIEPRFCLIGIGISEAKECGSEAIDSLELLVLPLPETIKNIKKKKNEEYVYIINKTANNKSIKYV